MAVAKIVDAVGLTGTLGAAAATLALSAAFAERAYGISEKYGFNPADEHDAEKAKEVAKAAKPGAGTKKGAAAVVVAEKPPGMIKKASDLFSRVPVLKSLFVEILACQGLSTILNVCYVNKLSTTIEDDRERAGWSGKFFAVINLVSGFLQFAVLPPLMSVIEPAALWRAMPLIMMAFTAYLGVDDDPTLVLVAGTFLAMKAMEFSARRMLDEMVYVPLDFDSRYVGKEVIGVFGYRFGKSGMSLALSALTSSDLGNLGLRQLTWLTTAAAAVWLRFTWRLSNQVLTREEAQRAYEEKRKATAAGGAKGAKKGKK
uniref:ADP,ATP carrier protein n=1 Tax=Trieres chinensis TaxID=1514140 RepID=A0A7S1ZMJ9_TRICV